MWCFNSLVTSCSHICRVISTHKHTYTHARARSHTHTCTCCLSWDFRASQSLLRNDVLIEVSVICMCSVYYLIMSIKMCVWVQPHVKLLRKQSFFLSFSSVTITAESRRWMCSQEVTSFHVCVCVSVWSILDSRGRRCDVRLRTCSCIISNLK